MPVNISSAQDRLGNGQQPITVDERIIVIGASAGGLDALKMIIKGLPPGFSAPVFIVWHMSPDIRGILPQLFNSINTIHAAHAYDKEPIKTNRIYVAPPDHHLLVEENRVRVTHGPKENRFRPAVDPLFRSAAYTFGNRVIGIILSGALDDGTAGLGSVKQYGGVAIVQNPVDAQVPSMPENAMREVEVDYTVTAGELPALLVKLLQQQPSPVNENMKDEKTKKEIEIAAEERALDKGVFKMGEPSVFACPECHGVLSAIQDVQRIRYRCHTGHAYSADSLLASISEKIEDSLYSAIRGMEESIMLLNHIGDHYAEANHSRLAALYFQKAKEVQERSDTVRAAILNNEFLSKEAISKQSDALKNRNVEAS
ncbi:MAG: chemotaxis protein CheB [Parafilimonas sp.]